MYKILLFEHAFNIKNIQEMFFILISIPSLEDPCIFHTSSTPNSEVTTFQLINNQFVLDCTLKPFVSVVTLGL